MYGFGMTLAFSSSSFPYFISYVALSIRGNRLRIIKVFFLNCTSYSSNLFLSPADAKKDVR